MVTHEPPANAHQSTPVGGNIDQKGNSIMFPGKTDIMGLGGGKQTKVAPAQAR